MSQRLSHRPPYCADVTAFEVIDFTLGTDPTILPHEHAWISQDTWLAGALPLADSFDHQLMKKKDDA
jgi:hypothetical protein